MFQWKTKFPARPSPPTPEQQKEDLKTLKETNFDSNPSINIDGDLDIMIYQTTLTY